MLDALSGVSTARKYRIAARLVIIVIASVMLYVFSILVQERQYGWALIPAIAIALLTVAEFVVADLVIDARFPPQTAEVLERLQAKLNIHDEILIVLGNCIRSFRACDHSQISATVHLCVDVVGVDTHKTNSALIQLSDYTRAGLGGRRWRTIEVTKGLVGRCVRLQRADWVNFRSADEYHRRMVSEFGFTRDEVSRHTSTARSYLAVPMIDQAEVVGVLYFFSTEPQVFPHAAREGRLNEAASQVLALLRTAEIV
jgi:GAF domain-containing protein